MTRSISFFVSTAFSLAIFIVPIFFIDAADTWQYTCGDGAPCTREQYIATGGADGGGTVQRVSDTGTAGNIGGNTQSSGNIGGNGSPAGNVGGNKNTSLVNPLKVGSISDFLFAIIDIILTFALPIIILFIMYAGFLFVTARGDTGQIETARTALLWAVVGGVIVLGARVIFTVIKGTVDALKVT